MTLQQVRCDGTLFETQLGEKLAVAQLLDYFVYCRNGMPLSLKMASLTRLMSTHNLTSPFAFGTTTTGLIHGVGP